MIEVFEADCRVILFEFTIIFCFRQKLKHTCQQRKLGKCWAVWHYNWNFGKKNYENLSPAVCCEPRFLAKIYSKNLKILPINDNLDRVSLLLETFFLVYFFCLLDRWRKYIERFSKFCRENYHRGKFKRKLPNFKTKSKLLQFLS